MGARARTSRRSRPLLATLQQTLDSFVDIGLGYLSASTAPSGTLSGGEAQRTKMIRHLGSSLTDVTYVFDEPTVGLHPHDIQRMNELLLRLRDKGNTVLVVEHKPETIAIADHVVDLGPRAGVHGGEIQFEGDRRRAPRNSDTLTGRHLDYRAQLKDAVRTATGAARDPRRDAAQPARTSTSTCRSACSPSSPASPGRARARSSTARSRGMPDVVSVDQSRDQGLAPQQPGDLHRPARPDPHRLRQGERRQARAVQRELRGRLPELQRRRRHLHRPRR